MNIGIPKERRPFESRVGLSPAGVEILTQHGHQIYVEHEAGVGAGFDDREFETAGARVIAGVESFRENAGLVFVGAGVGSHDRAGVAREIESGVHRNVDARVSCARVAVLQAEVAVGRVDE